MASRRSILSFRYNRFSSSSLLALMARLDRPIRDHLWQGLPVTRNAEIDPGDNAPPPKMTQGVMTPLPPLHHLQQHPRAGSQGVGIATLIFRYFRYFLRYFSSTHGWTVLAGIKGHPMLAAIPVVLLSIVDQKNRGYALGAADYLVKPVDRTKLIETLTNI